MSPDGRKRLRRSALLLGLIATLLISLQLKPIAKAAYSLQASVAFVGTTIGTFYQNTFTKKDDLLAEVEHYKQLSADLTVDKAYLDQLEQDVQELQTLIDYSQQLTYQAIPARILARSVAGDHQILVDRGYDQDVREQMAVIVEEGHMIGYTSTVNRHTSVVTLLKDVNARVPVAILGETRTVGLVSGQDGFLLKMEFIPQSEKIAESDVVVTSGLDGNFPSGLVVGVVNEVIQNERSEFQEALIEPIFDPDVYTNVLILDPFNEAYAP